MRRFTPFLIAAALLGAAAPAAVMAQTGAPARIPRGAILADVSVTLGPELVKMSDRYGERELSDLVAVLQRRVAIDAGKGGFTRADIVLEDARPNRPTLEQQSRNVGLSFQSLSIGGATVTGTLTRADGTRQPLTFSYYESDLRQEIGATTWYDADRAFSFLGGSLSRGDVPTRYGPAASRTSIAAAATLTCGAPALEVGIISPILHGEYGRRPGGGARFSTERNACGRRFRSIERPAVTFGDTTPCNEEDERLWRPRR